MKKFLLSTLLFAGCVQAHDFTFNAQEQAIMDKVAAATLSPEFIEQFVRTIFASPAGDVLWQTYVEQCNFNEEERAMALQFVADFKKVAMEGLALEAKKLAYCRALDNSEGVVLDNSQAEQLAADLDAVLDAMRTQDQLEQEIRRVTAVWVEIGSALKRTAQDLPLPQISAMRLLMFNVVDITIRGWSDSVTKALNK